jgi:hypothetical protein
VLYGAVVNFTRPVFGQLIDFLHFMVKNPTLFAATLPFAILVGYGTLRACRKMASRPIARRELVILRHARSVP